MSLEGDGQEPSHALCFKTASKPFVNCCVGAHEVRVSYTAHLKQIKLFAEQVGVY